MNKRNNIISNTTATSVVTVKEGKQYTTVCGLTKKADNPQCKSSSTLEKDKIIFKVQ